MKILRNLRDTGPSTTREDRDRELLVEEIISVYRGCRARSELTSRAELMYCSCWTQDPSRGRETPQDKN